ncbi:MAG TPA: ATP-binding protein [Bacteroidales bacterium]|nr:ATP-binding protein [Bacteroidales bacterium]
MVETVQTATVPVNVGRLLENQLKKWEGGGHHPRGIAEYITNSDDSYRRLKKYNDNLIIVEIHSRSGEKIEKVIVQDFTEGMSFSDLENKFFQYFESFSGREKGEKVIGRFGTGGKAYAIMNFRHCWITSVQNGKECKAWFKWDYQNKQIIRGYNNGGYKDTETVSPNGTIIVLESSINVKHQLKDFVVHLEKLGNIRHILKSQKIIFKIIRPNQTEQIDLKYSEPDPDIAQNTWRFVLPKSIKNESEDENQLIIRYFEKPISEHAFIDLSDGISSVEDLHISAFDDRQFAKYINGNLIVSKLQDSVAVKENRRGLEEGDDLTEDIKLFIGEKINQVIDEIENAQKQLDKEKRINAANEKLKELSKFLSKQDLKFNLEIKELKKRFTKTQEFPFTDEKEPELSENDENKPIFRKPLPEDPEELLTKGRWIIKTEENTSNGGTSHGTPEFIPDKEGEDVAIKIGEKVRTPAQHQKSKKGLQVKFSNDSNNSESPTFSEYDDPVSDRDLTSKGIIWINAVHPIIIKFDNIKSNDAVRNENIANFVLIIVAQYYAQKESELQPEDDRDDPLLLFRKYFFKLQIEIRNDDEISYYENE